MKSQGSEDLFDGQGGRAREVMTIRLGRHHPSRVEIKTNGEVVWNFQCFLN